MVQSPWRMQPGRPACFANSGSMWIGFGWSDASAWRLVSPASGVTFSSGIAAPSLRSVNSAIFSSSHSADDVGPGRQDRLLPILVRGPGLEDVETLPVFLVDLLALGGGGDHVARADRLAPLERLAPVDHRREVDADLAVEDRRPHRGGAVDHGEHRGRDQIAKADRFRRLRVVVELALGSDRIRVLADPVGLDLELDGLPLLANGVC